MPYLPLFEAARYYRIAPKSLQRRAQRGQCQRISEDGQAKYWVPDEISGKRLEESYPDFDQDAEEERLDRYAKRSALTKLQKEAKFGRALESCVRAVFTDMGLKPYAGPVRAQESFVDARHDAVIYHTDAHVGKLTPNSTKWDFEQARQVILGSADEAIRRIERQHPINRIITGIGGDWCNIDNVFSGTSKGTQQQGAESWHEVMRWAAQIKFELLLRMAEKAPVLAVTIPGNHDRMWSTMAGEWLWLAFRDHPNIEVRRHKARHYMMCGETLVMMTHGDNARPNQYKAIMTDEEPKLWGDAKARVAFHGHMHHHYIHNYGSLEVIQLPSITPDDDYHIGLGYVGNVRSLQAHTISHVSGRGFSFDVKVDPDGNILP